MESQSDQVKREALLDCETLMQLSQQALNIEDFVYSWIAPNREVVFNSIRSDTGEVKGVAITFNSGGHELWAIKISLTQINETFPNLENIGDAYIPHLSTKERMEFDDNWFKARDRRLGVEYLEGLGVDAVGPSSGIEYALGFAISKDGETVIMESDLCIIDMEESEIDKLPRGRFLVAHASYAVKEFRYDLCESMIIFLPD